MLHWGQTNGVTESLFIILLLLFYVFFFFYILGGRQSGGQTFVGGGGGGATGRHRNNIFLHHIYCEQSKVNWGAMEGTRPFPPPPPPIDTPLGQTEKYSFNSAVDHY